MAPFPAAAPGAQRVSALSARFELARGSLADAAASRPRRGVPLAPVVVAAAAAMVESEGEEEGGAAEASGRRRPAGRPAARERSPASHRLSAPRAPESAGRAQAPKRSRREAIGSAAEGPADQRRRAGQPLAPAAPVGGASSTPAAAAADAARARVRTEAHRKQDAASARLARSEAVEAPALRAHRHAAEAARAAAARLAQQHSREAAAAGLSLDSAATPTPASLASFERSPGIAASLAAMYEASGIGLSRHDAWVLPSPEEARAAIDALAAKAPGGVVDEDLVRGQPLVALGCVGGAWAWVRALVGVARRAITLISAVSSFSPIERSRTSAPTKSCAPAASCRACWRRWFFYAVWALLAPLLRRQLPRWWARLRALRHMVGPPITARGVRPHGESAWRASCARLPSCGGGWAPRWALTSVL